MKSVSKTIKKDGNIYKLDFEFEPLTEANILKAIKYQIKKHFNNAVKKRQYKKSSTKNPKLVKNLNTSDNLENIASKLVSKLNSEIKNPKYKELAQMCAFSYTDNEDERRAAAISNNYSLSNKGLIIYAYTKNKSFLSITEYNPFKIISKLFNSVCEEMFKDNKIAYKQLKILDRKVYFVIYFIDESERNLLNFVKDLKNDKFFDTYEFPIDYLTDEDILAIRKIKPFFKELISKSSFKLLVTQNTFDIYYNPYSIGININIMKDPSIKPYLTEYYKYSAELNDLLDEIYKTKTNDNNIWAKADEVDKKCYNALCEAVDKYIEEKIKLPIKNLKYEKLKSFNIDHHISGGSDTDTTLVIYIDLKF